MREREAKGLSAAAIRIPVNPRNAAAGSLRQLDAAITDSRELKYFIYGWGEVSSEYQFTNSHAEFREQLRILGFNILAATGSHDMRVTMTIEELLNYYRNVQNDRSNLPYDIDGMVYKVDRLDWQAQLGFVGSGQGGPCFELPFECAGSVVIQSPLLPA